MGFLPPPDSRCGTAAKINTQSCQTLARNGHSNHGKVWRGVIHWPSNGRPAPEARASAPVWPEPRGDWWWGTRHHFLRSLCTLTHCRDNKQLIWQTIINVFTLFVLCVQWLFIASGFYSPHKTDLATSLQKTTGTLAWKSDSTSANSTGNKSETRVNLGSWNSSLVHSWTFSCSIVERSTFMSIGSVKRQDTLDWICISKIFKTFWSKSLNYWNEMCKHK